MHALCFLALYTYTSSLVTFLESRKGTTAQLGSSSSHKKPFVIVFSIPFEMKSNLLFCCSKKECLGQACEYTFSPGRFWVYVLSKISKALILNARLKQIFTRHIVQQDTGSNICNIFGCYHASTHFRYAIYLVFALKSAKRQHQHRFLTLAML